MHLPVLANEYLLQSRFLLLPQCQQRAEQCPVAKNTSSDGALHTLLFSSHQIKKHSKLRCCNIYRKRKRVREGERGWERVREGERGAVVSRVVHFFLIQMMLLPHRSSSASQIIGTSVSHRQCYVSRYMFPLLGVFARHIAERNKIRGTEGALCECRLSWTKQFCIRRTIVLIRPLAKLRYELLFPASRLWLLKRAIRALCRYRVWLSINGGSCRNWLFLFTDTVLIS